MGSPLSSTENPNFQMRIEIKIVIRKAAYSPGQKIQIPKRGLKLKSWLEKPPTLQEMRSQFPNQDWNWNRDQRGSRLSRIEKDRKSQFPNKALNQNRDWQGSPPLQDRRSQLSNKVFNWNRDQQGSPLSRTGNLNSQIRILIKTVIRKAAHSAGKEISICK